MAGMLKVMGSYLTNPYILSCLTSLHSGHVYLECDDSEMGSLIVAIMGIISPVTEIPNLR